jgi:hypothetical protein
MTDKETRPPDFSALRAKRNAELQALNQRLIKEYGEAVHALFFDSDACYCACGTGGPCEHQWDGVGWASSDGAVWTTTCSRCGMSAMSHDSRVAS